MSDRPESTAPPVLDEVDRPLRATFAALFHPAVVEQLERLVSMAHGYVVLVPAVGRPYTLAGQLAAVASDLRFAGRYLRQLAAWPAQIEEPTPEDERLAGIAATIGPRVLYLGETVGALAGGERAVSDDEILVAGGRLVLFYLTPEEATRWEAAAGDADLAAWVRALVNRSAPR